jgi:MFS family permease
VFPLFVQELAHADEGAAARITGNILSVTGVVAALGAFALGRLSDRWGHRRMLLLCVVGTAVLSSAQAFATSVGQLFALRLLFGLAAAGLIPAANAIIHRVVPRHSIGKAFGATASLGALGFSLGPLVGGYMAAYTLQHHPTLSYRPPFIFCGMVLFMVAGLVFWGIKPARLRSNEAETADAPPAAVLLTGGAAPVPPPQQPLT